MELKNVGRLIKQPMKKNLVESSNTFFGSGFRFLVNKFAIGGAGAMGGIAGGLINGVIILSVGKFAEITEKFGAPSQGFAFFMHMFFCTLMGISFGVICDRFASTIHRSILSGMVYSVTLGVLAVFVVMPIRFGEDIPVNAESIMSTAQIHVGHALFGLILGLVYPAAKRVMKVRKVMFAGAGCFVIFVGIVAGFIARGNIRLPSGPTTLLSSANEDVKDEQISRDDMSGVPSLVQDMVFGGQTSIQKNDRTDRIFSLRDSNKDGKLTSSELPGPFKKILASGDMDGDGFLSRAELSSGIENGLLLELDLPSPLKAIFTTSEELKAENK